jgi:hypothetical protein
MLSLHWLNRLIPVPSVVIQSFNYESASRQLVIEFQSQQRYAYYDVPAEVFREMRASGARDAYFNQHIRDRYSYSRLAAFGDEGPRHRPAG